MAFFKTGRLPPIPLKKLEDILTGPDRNPRTGFSGVAGYPCAHQLESEDSSMHSLRSTALIAIIPGLKIQNSKRS